MDHLLLSFIFKMAVTAAVVVTASLVVERTGPFLGAMVATLPISAGPSYVFLAYEHGPVFVERSSLTSLAASASTAAFIVFYATLASRWGVLVSVGGALAAWLAAVWVITQIEWSLSEGLLLNAVAYGGAIFLIRKLFRVSDLRAIRSAPWWAIPVRAVGVMGLVAVVIITGRLIGPTAAGVAALAPVVMTSLAVVLHPLIGGTSTALVLVNALFGMLGVALALAALHVLVVPSGSAVALSAALIVCIIWNAFLIVGRRLLAT